MPSRNEQLAKRRRPRKHSFAGGSGVPCHPGRCDNGPERCRGVRVFTLVVPVGEQPGPDQREQLKCCFSLRE